MDFGEFISGFDKGYRRMIDRVTNKSLTKPYFCRELLCNITKDENIVLYENCIPDIKHVRCESAFYAFYRNSQRRSLHPIAEGIINGNSLDTNKFKCFLAKYVKHYSKENLLENFKRHLTDISSETLFDDITNEFVRILREEAAKEDRRRRKPISTDKPDCDNENAESVEAKMDIMLQTLITTGRKIAEFRKTGVADDVRYRKLKTSLHNNFEQLTSLANSLSTSNEAGDSPIIKDIVDSVMSLDENNFILTTDEYMIESSKNYHIHRLSSLLSQV